MTVSSILDYFAMQVLFSQLSAALMKYRNRNRRSGVAQPGFRTRRTMRTAPTLRKGDLWLRFGPKASRKIRICS